MPRIPQFESSGQLRTAGATVRNAGIVGSAVAEFGARAAGISTAIIRRQNDANDTAFITEQRNGLSRQWTERQIELEQSGEDIDFDGLKKEYDKSVSLSLKSAPSERASSLLKADADSIFTNKIFPSMARHQAGRNVEKRVSSTNTAIDDINAEVLTGRTDITEALARSESAIAGLEETTGGVVDTAKLRESTRNELGKSALQAQIENDPQAALTQMNAGDWDQFTSSDDLKVLRKTAKKTLADNASQAQAQQAQANAILSSDLEVDVSRGEASYSDINSARDDNVISSQKWAQLTKQLDKQSVELKEKANTLSKIRVSLGAGIPLDPTSKEDKEGVDLMWEEISSGFADLPPDEFADNAIQFIKSTNILPDQLKGSIAAFSRSGDTSQAVQSADLVSRMSEENLPALNDLTPESRAMGLMISDQMKSGISAGQAVENARVAAFGLTESEKSIIKEQSRLASPDLKASLDTFVDKAFDPSSIPFFGEEPDVTPAMLGEYRVSFDRFMQLTKGNIEQSQKLAFQGITKVWGVTEVGGSSRFMKYAPEAVYRIAGIDNQWIENQFNEDMLLVGAEEAVLASDADTARSEKPSYPILVPNDEGLMVPLKDENLISQRWQPDFKGTLEFQELSEKPSPIEEAREQREFNRERRAIHVQAMIESRVVRRFPVGRSAAFLDTDEGKARALVWTENLLNAEKINKQDAKNYLNSRGIEFDESIFEGSSKKQAVKREDLRQRQRSGEIIGEIKEQFIERVTSPIRAIERTTQALTKLGKE